MPRAFNENFKEKFESGSPHDIFRVVMTFGNSSTREFISGEVPLGNAELGLAGLAVTPSKTDLVSRKTTMAEWILTFVDDGVMRDLIAQTSPTVLGARVDIYRGTTDLHDGDFDDFELIGSRLVVTEVQPDRGSIDLILEDNTALVLDEDVTPYGHPEPILRRIKDALENTLSSNLVDSTAFDSTDAANADFAHINVATHLYGQQILDDWVELIDSEDVSPQGQSMTPPTLRIRKESAALVNTIDMVDDLTFITRGTTYRGDDGKWTFVAYDRAGAGVRHFQVHDVSDFEQLTTYEDMINSLSLNGYGAFGQDQIEYISGKDATSQSDFGYEDNPNPNIPYNRHRSFKNRWFQAFAAMRQDIFGRTFSDVAGVQLTVMLAGYRGFAGMWQEDGGGTPVVPPSLTQQAAHQLNAGAGRYGWFKITDHQEGGKREIVRATSVLFEDPLDTQTTFVQLPTKLGPRKFWRYPLYTVDRADGSATFFNTTQQNWTQFNPNQTATDAFIYDITAAKYVLDSILDRQSRGAPMIRFNVPGHNSDLRLGELVSLDTDLFLKDGVDGATSSTLFELLSANPTSDGKLKLTCAFARDGAPGSAVVPEYVDPNDEQIVPVATPTQFLLGQIGTIIHDIYGSDNDKMRVS